VGKLLPVLMTSILAVVTACSTTAKVATVKVEAASVDIPKKSNCNGEECCADSAPIR